VTGRGRGDDGGSAQVLRSEVRFNAAGRLQQSWQQARPHRREAYPAGVRRHVNGSGHRAATAMDGRCYRAQPFLQLLVYDRVALPAYLADDLPEPVRISSSSLMPASSTRPIEVAYAGNRVPTEMATVMMRFVGTRAT